MRPIVINHLSQYIKVKHGIHPAQQSYLEIGICNGDTFSKVSIGQKEGVDPKPIGRGLTLTKYKKTSDDFFSTINPIQKYDIIFIDGLHHHEQVWRDIVNSLKAIKDEGFIVVDDVHPENEGEQNRKQCPGAWTGDVWKTWVAIQQIFSPQITTVVRGSTNTGCRGLGIIKIEKDTPRQLPPINPNSPENLKWPQDFKNNIKAITLEEFKKKFQI